MTPPPPPPLIEDRNKRGTMYVSSPRKIITCTVRELKEKIERKHAIIISVGEIIKLKPFFITYATEKEKVLCMCKICLNTRMLFSPLMEHSKACNGPVFSSISEYFMEACSCPMSKNGYYQLKCCEGKCAKYAKVLNLLLFPI